MYVSLIRAIFKQTTTSLYNWRVRPRKFQVGDLEMQREGVGGRNAYGGTLVAIRKDRTS